MDLTSVLILSLFQTGIISTTVCIVLFALSAKLNFNRGVCIAWLVLSTVLTAVSAYGVFKLAKMRRAKHARALDCYRTSLLGGQAVNQRRATEQHSSSEHMLPLPDTNSDDEVISLREFLGLLPFLPEVREDSPDPLPRLPSSFLLDRSPNPSYPSFSSPSSTFGVHQKARPVSDQPLSQFHRSEANTRETLDPDTPTPNTPRRKLHFTQDQRLSAPSRLLSTPKKRSTGSVCPPPRNSSRRENHPARPDSALLHHSPGAVRNFSLPTMAQVPTPEAGERWKGETAYSMP